MTVRADADNPKPTMAGRRLLLTGLLLASLIWSGSAAAQTRLTVEVIGIDGDLAENAYAFLSIAQLQSKRGLLSGVMPIPIPGLEDKPDKEISDSDVRRLHLKAEQEIRLALQPYGYYSAQTEASLEKVNGEWLAVYKVDPGPATRVSHLQIEVEGPGRDDPGVRQALDEVGVRVNRRLVHSRYDNAKKSLVSAAIKAGYLDARFTQSQMLVSPERRSAEITLIMDTGPRYFFGPVTVSQEILDPEFVARFVKAETGEPFDTQRLLATQLALSDSGYFRRVEVQIKRDEAEDFRVPVVIETEPNKPRRYATGLGFGTDTGPRLSLATEFRRVNRHGHRILADMRVSDIKQSVGLQYGIPVRNVETDRLVFSGTAESENVSDDGKTDRYSVGASLNEAWGSYRRSVYVNLQREDFSIGDDEDTVTYLIPGANLSRLRADNAVFPRRGYSLTGDVRGSAARLISETSFFRSEATARIVWPLATDMRLIMRGQIGFIAVEEFSKLPLNERFFAGGDQSVRGYGYQRLGPTDDTGEVVGGRYLTAVSAEVDYLFVGNFGAAVFVDSGNADDSFPVDPYTGAGVGFRWRSPVGMFRLDFAHPFTNSDDRYRIHLSIGPTL